MPSALGLISEKRHAPPEKPMRLTRTRRHLLELAIHKSVGG